MSAKNFKCGIDSDPLFAKTQDMQYVLPTIIIIIGAYVHFPHHI